MTTRTIRTPAFWGYPPPPHDYPYHWVILDPKSKEDKVKVTNLKNSPKFQIFKRALHATHLLKLLDKMCKYEMDPMSIVEDTERTRFCPQTDRWTDGLGDTSIPPFQLRWSGGYKNYHQPDLYRTTQVYLYPPHGARWRDHTTKGQESKKKQKRRHTHWKPHPTEEQSMVINKITPDPNWIVQ